MDERADLGLHRHIEADRRLIEKDDFGIVQKRR
jgi:hypothetical protein